ncbi:hypothetical protein JCM5350_007300 [Sporobolomyces pararoseus]
MSTTPSPPPSTKPQGECVVCGKICTTRCSSCAQHGLDWMYFCSTEHQKLVSTRFTDSAMRSPPLRVTGLPASLLSHAQSGFIGCQIWFTHKRTCGKYSNRFRWPPLNQREREEWKAVKNYRYTNAQGEVYEWEGIYARFGIPFEIVLDRYSKAHYDYSATREVQLVYYHGRAFGFKHEKDKEDLSTSSSQSTELYNLELSAREADDPFGLLANYLNRHWDNLVELDCDKYEWKSDLLNKLIILFSLVCRNHADPHLYLDHSPLLIHTTAQLDTVLETRVKPDFPSKAEEIRTDLDSVGMRTFEHPETGGLVGLWALESHLRQ